MCPHAPWISSVLQENGEAWHSRVPAHSATRPVDLPPQAPGDVLRYARFVRLAARGIAGRVSGAEAP